MGVKKNSFIKMDRTHLIITVTILACMFLVDFQVANGMELKTKGGDIVDTGKLMVKEQQAIKNPCCCPDCFLCCQFADCCCNIGCVELGGCCAATNNLLEM